MSHEARELSAKVLTQTKERLMQEELQTGLKLSEIVQLEQHMNRQDWVKIHRMQEWQRQASAAQVADQFGTPSIEQTRDRATEAARTSNPDSGQVQNAEPGRGDIIRVPSGNGYIEINAGPGCGEGPIVVDRDLKNDQSRVNESARPDRDNSDHLFDAKNSRLHLNEDADPTIDRSNKTKDVKN